MTGLPITVPLIALYVGLVLAAWRWVHGATRRRRAADRAAVARHRESVGLRMSAEWVADHQPGYDAAGDDR